MKRILSTLAIVTASLLGVSCSDRVQETVDDTHANADANQTKKGWISEDNDILNLLNEAQIPQGTVRSDAPRTFNDTVPVVVVDDEESQSTPGEQDGIPGYYVTSYTKYKMSQEFDETFILDPASDILYPGCVLRGQSLENSTYAFFNGCNTGIMDYALGGLTLKNGDSEELVGHADNIRYTDYIPQFNKWSNLEYKNNDALESSYSMFQINSKQEAQFHAGISVGNKLFNLVGGLDFDYKNYKNHFLVKFIQKKFQVTLGQPKGRSTIFTEINPNAMGKVQPVYVSNIKYGRMLFIAVSTNESAKKVTSALSFAFNVKGVDVSAEMKQNYQDIVAGSKIDCNVYGGGQENQNNIITGGLDGVTKFVKTPMAFNEVVPISFQIRFSADNALARVVSRTEFKVPTRTFIPNFSKVLVQMHVASIRATGGPLGNQVYGTIAAYPNSDEAKSVMLMNITSDGHKAVPSNNEFIPFNQPAQDFRFTKDKNTTIDDFMYNQKLHISANLIEWWRVGRHRPYNPVNMDISINNLLKIYNSPDKSFIIDTQSDGHTCGVKIVVDDIKFFASDGQAVQMKKINR